MIKYCIIIEPDPVVRLDIEGMLLDAYPGCQVTMGATLLDVGAGISNCGPDSALFVRGTMMSECDGLERVVQTAAVRGCRTVIIGHAKHVDWPATFIDLPFTTETMMLAIAQGTGEGGTKAVC